MIGGLLVAAALVTAVATADLALAQQPASTPGRGGAAATAEPAPDAATFVTHAASLTMLQLGAAERAPDQASREEVRDLARDVARSQRVVMQRLEARAGQLDVGVPSALLLEHQAVLEGLAPLTGEEFDRRYAEMQVQAADQTVALYRAAAERGGEPAMAALANEVLPDLERDAAAARELLEAVRP